MRIILLTSLLLCSVTIQAQIDDGFEKATEFKQEEEKRVEGYVTDYTIRQDPSVQSDTNPSIQPLTE